MRKGMNIQLKNKSQWSVNIYKTVKTLIDKEMKIKVIMKHHFNHYNLHKLRATGSTI